MTSLFSMEGRVAFGSLIEDARGSSDYAEEGSGPTVLLVPGSWGTRSACAAASLPLAAVSVARQLSGGTRDEPSASSRCPPLTHSSPRGARRSRCSKSSHGRVRELIA